MSIPEEHPILGESYFWVCERGATGKPKIYVVRATAWDERHGWEFSDVYGAPIKHTVKRENLYQERRHAEAHLTQARQRVREARAERSFEMLVEIQNELARHRRLLDRLLEEKHEHDD